jgi:hypothetical protein
MSSPIPSNSLEADVRAHFCLSQAELGRFIGVSAAQVGHVEAGRRSFSNVAHSHFRLLSWLLPPDLGGLGPAAPDDPAPQDFVPVDANDLVRLRQRLRRCHHLADNLRYELDILQARARAHHRREWGVRILHEALQPAPGAAPLVPFLITLTYPRRDVAREARWLALLAAATAAVSVPTPLEQRLMALRIRLLDEEAAELTKILADNEPPAAS